MNAPTNIRSRRDDYVPQVTAILPTCEGKELALRCSILLVRDRATAALRRCSDEACGILQTVERLASIYAFQSMAIERLDELRSELVRLLTCASNLEMFAYKMAGGQDARG